MKQTSVFKILGFLVLAVIIFFILKKIGEAIHKKKIESGYYPVEYATYPRLTGNDIADIQLLRGYQ